MSGHLIHDSLSALLVDVEWLRVGLIALHCGHQQAEPDRLQILFEEVRLKFNVYIFACNVLGLLAIDDLLVGLPGLRVENKKSS